MRMSPCTSAKVRVLSTAVAASRGRTRMLAQTGLNGPARRCVTLVLPWWGITDGLAPPFPVQHELRGSRTISSWVRSQRYLTGRGGLDRDRIRGHQRILRLRFRHLAGASRGRTGEVNWCNSRCWYRGWSVNRWHWRHGSLLDAIFKQHTSDAGRIVPRVMVVLHTQVDMGQVSSWGCPLDGNKEGASNLLGRV